MLNSTRVTGLSTLPDQQIAVFGCSGPKKRDVQMSIEDTKFENIELEDIDSLVTNKVPESRTLEYKLKLPGNARKDKVDFLAEISALANSAGGLMIFGIKDKGGVAEAVKPVSSGDPDAEILRLEGSARNGISPRLPSLETKYIRVSDDEYLFVMKTKKSWFLPHRVTYDGHDQFYGRASTGKYPLDVTQLRELFLLSESASTRLENFQADRLIKIDADQTPVALEGELRVVLHVVPYDALQAAPSVDTSNLYRDHGGLLGPLGTSGYDHRHNFDGLLTYSGRDAAHARRYLQIFRSGALEAVESFSPPGETTIPSQRIEVDIVDAVERYLRLLGNLGVAFPISVMVALMNVRGLVLAVNRRFTGPFPDVYPIDRKDLVIPGVLFEQFDADVPAMLRPIFDAIWSAGGYPRSLSYDPSSGRWRLR